MDTCKHPDISITPKTFSDGSRHLERRCVACRKQLGYAPHPKKQAGGGGKGVSGGERIHFGMHKGQTFDWIAREDRSYFEWFLKQPDVRRSLRQKIQAALDRNPRQVYIPPVLVGEQKEAMEKVSDMRSMGLDFFLDKQ